MSFYLNGTEISILYLNGTEIDAAYLNGTQVFTSSLWQVGNTGILVENTNVLEEELSLTFTPSSGDLMGFVCAVYREEGDGGAIYGDMSFTGTGVAQDYVVNGTVRYVAAGVLTGSSLLIELDNDDTTGSNQLSGIAFSVNNYDSYDYYTYYDDDTTSITVAEGDILYAVSNTDEKVPTGFIEITADTVFYYAYYVVPNGVTSISVSDVSDSIMAICHIKA